MKIESVWIFSVLLCFAVGAPTMDKLRKNKTNRKKFVPIDQLKICSNNDGSNICQNAEEYPMRTIEKLVKRKKYTTMFSNITVIEPGKSLLPIRRKFNSPKMTNLCRTITITVQPQAAFDYNSGETRFIVNTKDFQQSLVYERCVDEGSACLKQEQLPLAHETKCQQKFNSVRLVSLTHSGKLEYGKFLIPSTCYCSQSTSV